MRTSASRGFLLHQAAGQHVMPGLGKKEQLIAAAATLFHRRGYSRVSLADIANSTQMRQGNVYYYFKTKQELATAVLAHCDATLKDTIRLLEDLPPHERLTKFLDHIADQSTNYSQWGCPIAGLSVEMLLELQGNNDVQLLHVYTTYLNWFERTFKELGLTAPAAKQRSGLLLAGLQGSIHVAHVSGNDRVIHDFAESAKQQIATLV